MKRGRFYSLPREPIPAEPPRVFGTVNENPKAWSLALRGEMCREYARDAIDLIETVRDFSTALRLADPQRSRLFHPLVQALCEIVPHAACNEHDLMSILRILTTRFDDSRPGRPPSAGTPKKTWRRWLRALVILRFGSHRRAESLLRLCRRDFERYVHLPEYLVVTLDLGEALFPQKRRRRELPQLAAEAALRFRTLDSLEAREAVLLWRDTILHGDLTDEIRLHVRQRMSDWLRKDLAKRASIPGYGGPSSTRFEASIPQSTTNAEREIEKEYPKRDDRRSRRQARLHDADPRA